MRSGVPRTAPRRDVAESLHRAVLPRRGRGIRRRARPCAECRRERYNAFKRAWQLAHQLDEPPFADEMDAELHPARIEKRKKVTWEASLPSLPDGCFVQIEGDACLVLGDALLRWSPSGYTRRDRQPRDLMTTVLTPKPMAECFRKGYVPEIHETARLTLMRNWNSPCGVRHLFCLRDCVGSSRRGLAG